MDLFLGYDPGGNGRHGVAALAAGRLATSTMADSGEAVRWFHQQSGERPPSGIGIDTLLSWELSTSGWRAADHALRTHYPGAGKSVVSPNSLYGSMTVQGPAVALSLRKKWPEMLVTETHPKVLFHALTGKRYDWRQAAEMKAWLGRTFAVPTEKIADEHQWDAAISAVAVQQGATGNWKTNLVALSENPILPVRGARYFWPEDLTPRTRGSAR